MVSGRLGWRVSVLEIVAGLALGWALYVSFGLELSSVHESNGVYQAGITYAYPSTGNRNDDLQHEYLANLAILQAVLRKVALYSKSNRPVGQAQSKALPWLQGPADVLDRLRDSYLPSLPSQSSRSRSKEIARLGEPMEALHVGASDPIEFLAAGSQPGRGAAVAIITHIHVLSPFVRTWLNQAAALLSWRHAPGVRCLVATDSADVVIAVEALGCEALKGWVKTNGRGAALVPELLRAAAYAAPESPFIALAHPELMIGAGLADSLLALDAYEYWGGSTVRINASQANNGLQPLTDGHLKGAPVATLRHMQVMDGYSGIDAMLAHGAFGIQTNALLNLGGVASDSPSTGPVYEPLDGNEVRQQIHARAGLIGSEEIEALAASLPAGALPRVAGNLSSAVPPQQWSVKARPGSQERVGKLNDALEAVAARGGLASAKAHKFIAVRNPAFLAARSIVQQANSQPKMQPQAEAGSKGTLRRGLQEPVPADQAAVDPNKIRTDIRAYASKAASKIFGSMPKIAFDRLYWDRLTVQWLLGTGGVKGVPKEPSVGYSRVFAADLSASVVAVLPPPDFYNPKREHWSSFDWNAGDNKGGLKLDVVPESGPAGASACTIRQGATPVVKRPIAKPSRSVLESLQAAAPVQAQPANDTERAPANRALQASNATRPANQRALQGSARGSPQDKADIVEYLGPVEIKALLDKPLHALSPDARDRVEAAAAERGVSLQEIADVQQMVALARQDHGMQAQLLARELGWGAVWGEGSAIAAPCAAVLERFGPAGAAAGSLREELLVR